MEKITLVIDPKGINNIAFDFAIYLARLTKSGLTGLFLHEETPTAMPEIKAETFYPVLNPVVATTIGSERSSAAIEESKKAFSNYYRNRGFVVAPELEDAFCKEDVIEASRFTDIMIVSSEASFLPPVEPSPSGLTEYILRNAECPVIISPISFEGIEEIVFAYDGSPSSVFAIKEFTHLFPQLEDYKVSFLEVNNGASARIENQEKITDYLKMHYSAIGYKVLYGDPEDELFSYFIGKKNAFVVMGAFGRNIVSSFFNRSTAHLLLKTTTLPVFITHK